jgi:hypothetical protein
LYHKLLPVGLGLFAAVALAVTVALAEPEIGLLSAQGSAASVGASVTNAPASTTPVSGQLKIAIAIANTFSTTTNTVSVADVMAVRAQGLGWGEVYKVFLLKKLTGKSTTDILTMRLTEGWGEIYRSLGLNPGQGRNNLGQALKGAPLINTNPVSGTVTTKPNKPNKGKGDDQNDNDDQNDDKSQKQNKANPNPGNPNQGNPNNPNNNRPSNKPPKGKGK